MVRKIFVDSRFRDSGTFANFQTTLATPVLHPKCRAYLDNIHIPNLFYTIHDNAKHIYIVEQWLTNPGTAQEQWQRALAWVVRTVAALSNAVGQQVLCDLVAATHSIVHVDPSPWAVEVPADSPTGVNSHSCSRKSNHR